MPCTSLNIYTHLVHLCFIRLGLFTHQHTCSFFISQGLFGKSLDSPAAADADASDTQSVDSGLSRQDSSTGKRDTVCQVSGAHDSSLFLLKVDRHWVISCAYSSLCALFVFVRRSVRCTERVWWCVKVTVTDSFTWSVLVWHPYLRADSPVWNVEMVSESKRISYIFTFVFVFGSLQSQALCHSSSRQSSLF